MIRKSLDKRIEKKYNEIINEAKGYKKIKMIFERSIYISNKNSFKIWELLKILGKLNKIEEDNKVEDPYDFPAMGWLSWKMLKI